MWHMSMKLQFFRPTYPLTKLVGILEVLFYNLGKLFGHIGSLITYLHLDKIFDTISYDLKICYDLLISVRYVKDGIDYVASFFDNVYQVVHASHVVILVCSLGLIYISYRIYCWNVMSRMRNRMKRIFSRKAN